MSSVTGCSASSAALGRLSKSRPYQVTCVKRCIAALSPVYLSLLSAMTFADTDEKLPGMEVIYVTSERVASSELNTPYATVHIAEQDIRQQLYRSMPDVLRNASGVMVQKTAYGQGSPYIRGFTGFRTLFLVDGIRLNNSIFREGPNQYWNTVDPFSISELELVKGPSSALYGADAIGGTVQVFSAQLEPRLVQSETQWQYFLRGASAEHSQVVRGSVRHEQQGTAFQFGGTHKHFGDLTRGGDVAQPNTGYDEYNVDGKLVVALDEDLLLTSAAFYTRQDDVPRTHRTIYATSFAGTQIGNELRRDLDHERFLAYLRLDANKPFSFVDDMQLTLSWQKQQESRQRERSGSRFDTQGVRVDTLGLQVQLVSQWQGMQLVYGVESYLDSVDSDSSQNSIQGPVADDASYQWHGVYLQGRKALTESLDLLAGVRFNYMQAEADKVSHPVSGNLTSLNEHWSDTVFNLMFNYRLDNEQSLYTGVSQGFRAPNLSDLSRFDSARSNEFELPSTGLDSEHFTHFSLGYKVYTDKLKADLAVFYTDIQDQIERIPTGLQNQAGEFEISKANLGNGYMRGAELSLEYQFAPHWLATGLVAYITGQTSTYADSTQVLVNEYPSRLMPTTGQVSIKYQRDSWFAEAQWVGAKRADRLSSRDRLDSQRIPPDGTPGYGVLNLKASYQFNDQLELNMGLENLLDQDYRIHGSGQNEAGRNWIVGVSGFF